MKGDNNMELNNSKFVGSFEDAVEELKNSQEKTLDEIIAEVAEEEGMSFEETKKLFRKGMREALGIPNVSPKKKAKNRARNKQAKKSRRKNRK